MQQKSIDTYCKNYILCLLICVVKLKNYKSLYILFWTDKKNNKHVIYELVQHTLLWRWPVEWRCFIVKPTSSNDSAEAYKQLLLELLKEDQNILLHCKNKNIKKHRSDEKVNVSDLKSLISSLGKSTPLQTNGTLNTFPKPSCGKFSGSSNSEQSHKKNLRKNVEEKIKWS